ncbi:MAG: hypothetical protein HUK22_03270, partial [Thermoguttaceae bacterium]|nr:hypothetical protein [Thermoguttaceae bacterium]
DIQPIWDAHCVRCHVGDADPANPKAPFSLLGDEMRPIQEVQKQYDSKRVFSESYVNLTQSGNNDGPYIKWLNIQYGPEMQRPYVAGAATSPMLAQFRSAPADRPEYHRDVNLDELSMRKIALWIDLLVPFCGDYAEANRWTIKERAEHEYYMMKRREMARIVEANVAKKIASDESGVLPEPSDFETFAAGGCNAKLCFVSEFIGVKAPSRAVKTGAANVYRNLALNPAALQCDAEIAPSFPVATSNSEYGYLDEFAAKNVIDGATENRGHGPNFPSWGPNLRTDCRLTIHFGAPVEIDKVKLYLRADFPHDATWRSGTLVFTDDTIHEESETTLDVEFKATADAQTFEFPKRRVTSVTLTNLKSDFPLKWCGVTEFEVWGTSVETEIIRRK